MKNYSKIPGTKLKKISEMKNLFKIKYALGFLLLTTILLTSCDLELQENYDYEPEFDPLQTLENFTAWEWMNTRNADFAEGDLVNEVGQEFNIYIEMIKTAGLISEFQVPGNDKTFLLLNNEAFLKNRSLIAELTEFNKNDLVDPLTRSRNDDIVLLGSDQIIGIFNQVDRQTLRDIILYHIVDERVEQVASLPEFRVDYNFQTKLSGVDGEITIQRDERYRLGINKANSLPDTSFDTNVVRHNYNFKNGIGYIINNYVQKTDLIKKNG